MKGGVMTRETETLTAPGRRWAERHVFTSLVAKVALHGADESWPEDQVQQAIRQVNAHGAESASRALSHQG
jgi:hypothetical protein